MSDGEEIVADLPNSEEIADAAGGWSTMDEEMDLADAPGDGDPETAEAGGGDFLDQLADALTRAPEKSLEDIDRSEFFDPEAGGTDRVALVADDVISEGDGLQNWMHLLVAAVEIMVAENGSPLSGGDSSDDQGASDSGSTNSETNLSISGEIA